MLVLSNSAGRPFLVALAVHAGDRICEAVIGIGTACTIDVSAGALIGVCRFVDVVGGVRANEQDVAINGGSSDKC